MTTEIETLENARFGINDGYPYMEVQVNGRRCRIGREKALRLSGEIAALGPYDAFLDFFVIIPPSEEHGIHRHTRLEGYTNDRRYVALVREFVEAVDNSDVPFVEGPVEIPK